MIARMLVLSGSTGFTIQSPFAAWGDRWSDSALQPFSALYTAATLTVLCRAMNTRRVCGASSPQGPLTVTVARRPTNWKTSRRSGFSMAWIKPLALNTVLGKWVSTCCLHPLRGDILPVHVHIDKAGRDDEARGIDDLLALQWRFRDGRDAIALDADIHLAVKVRFRIDDPTVC